MNKNTGLIDRIARAAIAAVLFTLYLADVVTGAVGIVLLVVACILGITAVIGFCPMYKILGIDTCSLKK